MVTEMRTHTYTQYVTEYFSIENENFPRKCNIFYAQSILLL